MKRLVIAAVLSAGVLTACGDNSKLPARQDEAVEVAPVAPVEPARPMLDQVAADSACRLYIDSLYTGMDVTITETCVAQINGDAVEMATSHGRVMSAPKVSAGQTIEPVAGSQWHRAKPDAASGAWENPGAVFVTDSVEPLCLDVVTIARDATSDSMFVLRDTDEAPSVVSLTIDPAAEQVATLGQVSDGGRAAAFAVFAREPKVMLKSLKFYTCT